MAETLSNIESDVQHWMDDITQNISYGSDLRITNTIYQGMCTPDYEFLVGNAGSFMIGRRWPELFRKHSTLATILGQSIYTLPPQPVFNPVEFIIYIIDASSNNTRRRIPRAADTEAWEKAFSTSNSTPRVHLRYHDGTNHVIDFRPTPDTSGDTIQIWGLIEAPEFERGSDKTVFIHKNSDRALSMLIAAHYKAVTGDTGRAAELAGNAVGLLPKQDIGSKIADTRTITPWPI